MKAWGFFRGQGRLPSKSELAEVLKRVGYRHIKLDASARTIRFDTPGVEIDLGAIAKGYAVDRAVEILRDNGIRQALVSSGTSSLYALGSPPGEHGWKISVRDPLDTSKAACVLRLQNLSLAVSGDYEKFFKLGGKVYAHIMDPHTGMPVENMLSTAVVSPSATDSDALSTSFYVEGPDAARHYLDPSSRPDRGLLSARGFSRHLQAGRSEVHRIQASRRLIYQLGLPLKGNAPHSHLKQPAEQTHSDPTIFSFPGVPEDFLPSGVIPKVRLPVSRRI